MDWRAAWGEIAILLGASCYCDRIISSDRLSLGWCASLPYTITNRPLFKPYDWEAWELTERLSLLDYITLDGLNSLGAGSLEQFGEKFGDEIASGTSRQNQQKEWDEEKYAKWEPLIFHLYLLTSH